MTFGIIGFVCSAGLIVYSGSRLLFHGHRIAEITGWSKAWLGLILMAAVTSLPELVTGVSAVTIVKSPDLAVGDIFGSCVFNLLLLSLLDVRSKRPLSNLVSNGHVVAALFVIILLVTAGISIFAADSILVIGWFSLSTPLIIAIYLLAVRVIFVYEQKNSIELGSITKTDNSSLLRAFKAYGIHAMVVLSAALFLPHFGEQIAEKSGLGSTFFGTTFLAASTSLPELVVSLAAIRMGAYNMAVGNLLGSNVFNICILALDDLLYPEGSLFTVIEPQHLMSVLATMGMTAVAGLGMMIKPERKAWWVFSIDSLAIIIIYLVLMFHLYPTA